jgi:hypothetical protein
MNDRSNVVSFAVKRRKSLNARSALAYLARIAEGHPDGVVEVDNKTQLGTLLGWSQPRTSKQLTTWERTGKVTTERADNGKLLIRVIASRDDLERAGTPSRRTPMPKGKRATTRASGHKHASEPATDHANPANIDNGSIPYRNQSNSTGTQAMANAASENVPASTPNGMPQTAPSGTPPHRSSGPANRDVVHRAEDLNWRLAGDGGGDGDVLGGRHAPFVVVAAYLTALVLAVIAAWFSVRGMVVLYPGDPTSALVLGIGLETAKIVTVGLVAAVGRRLAWGFRIVLVLLAFGCEILNASGVFGQLVIAHLHKGAVAEASFERTDAEASGKIEVAQGRVADLDRRIATIDGMVDGAAQKGRSRDAERARRDKEPERKGLVHERDQARQELASLRTSRSSGSAQRKVDEAESAPVVWAARMIGIDRDADVIIRFIIALTVVCLDPLAIFLLAAVNSFSGRRRQWEAA